MWCEKQIWFIQIWNIFQFLFSNCLHSPSYYINDSLEIVSIYWYSFERSYEKHWCQGKREMKIFYFSRFYKNTQNERSTCGKHFLVDNVAFNTTKIHYVKSVRIRIFSCPYPVWMRENTGQENSEYGHFSRSHIY